MALELSLTSVTFSDGANVAMEPSSVLVIVGPNNAGKSQALRDIHSRLSADPGTPVSHRPAAPVVTDVAIRAEGTDDDLRDWLTTHAHENPAMGLPEPQFSRPGLGPVGLAQLLSSWQRRPPFGQLSQFFFAFAGGEQRLSLAGSTQVHDLANQPPTAPLQVLFVDEERERVLADAAQEAFGMRVIVNRVAGQNIHLHIGELPSDIGLPFVTNRAYRHAINVLPHVSNQGDGFRSYIGLLLLIASAEYPLILVDEPEAFLHPPQARALGRRLAQGASESESQLIVATHSLDVLQGVLAAPDVAVTVVRLQRDGDINRTAVLEPGRVRELWSDPIIRFSNALDGIFHRGVVVCEGDADARFYDATLQATRRRAGGAEHGLLFVHCGGKQRVPVIVNALRGLDVPVRVICDIDVLREEQPLRRILEGLGVDWETTRPNWNVVRAAIDAGQGRQPRVSEVRAEIDALLREAGDAQLTPALQRQVRQIAHTEDPWQVVKRSGVAGIPGGDATRAWQRLDSALRAAGLFVVPVGILERWNPAFGDHGPRWVVPVLEAGFHETEGPHADFVVDVDSAIA